MSRSTTWLYTINNPPANINHVIMGWSGTKYNIWQLERGESGTPHMQGYVIFKNQRRLEEVLNVYRAAHWEVRRGSHEQAKLYCSKAETRIGPGGETGKEPAPGARNDLLDIKNMVDNGSGMLDVAEAHFGTYIRNHRGLSVYAGMKRARQRNWPTKTYVYHGASGSGKTRRVTDEAGEDAYWMMKPSSSTVFFDGYDGQENVVIDEFYGWIPLDLLKRMCDRYPLLVNTKGGSTQFLAKKIFITSNSRPENWYRVGLQELERRFAAPLGVVEEMNDTENPWTPPNAEAEEANMAPVIDLVSDDDDDDDGFFSQPFDIARGALNNPAPPDLAGDMKRPRLKYDSDEEISICSQDVNDWLDYVEDQPLEEQEKLRLQGSAPVVRAEPSRRPIYVRSNNNELIEGDGPTLREQAEAEFKEWQENKENYDNEEYKPGDF